MSQNDIQNYADRLRPAGILYVDVYPYRVLANGSVRFLVLRRRTDVVLPGQWQAISGKIRAGERIADAFVRQVRSKTGQEPRRLHKLSAVTTFYDEYYDTVMLVPCAAAELADEMVVLDSTLHVEHSWLGLDGACAVMPFDTQHKALSAIEEAIQLGGRSAHWHPLGD